MVHEISYWIRYSDTDKFEVVYYGNYLRFFEMGRAELLRDHGITYAELEKEGIFAPVIETRVNYKKPARYDDMITIKTTVEHIGTTSMKFSYEIYDDHKDLLATGYTVHVFVDKALNKVDVPKEIKNSFLN